MYMSISQHPLFVRHKLPPIIILLHVLCNVKYGLVFNTTANDRNIAGCRMRYQIQGKRCYMCGSRPIIKHNILIDIIDVDRDMLNIMTMTMTMTMKMKMFYLVTKHNIKVWCQITISKLIMVWWQGDHIRTKLCRYHRTT